MTCSSGVRAGESGVRAGESGVPAGESGVRAPCGIRVAHSQLTQAAARSVCVSVTWLGLELGLGLGLGLELGLGLGLRAGLGVAALASQRRHEGAQQLQQAVEVEARGDAW